MVSMLSFPPEVGTHGVGNWSAGKVTPLLITVLLGKKRKQNKTNKLAKLVVISVKHGWIFASQNCGSFEIFLHIRMTYA